jgi:hypothetical protein
VNAEITREIPHIDGGQSPDTSLDPPRDAQEMRPAGAARAASPPNHPAWREDAA